MLRFLCTGAPRLEPLRRVTRGPAPRPPVQGGRVRTWHVVYIYLQYVRRGPRRMWALRLWAVGRNVESPVNYSPPARKPANIFGITIHTCRYGARLASEKSKAADTRAASVQHFLHHPTLRMISVTTLWVSVTPHAINEHMSLVLSEFGVETHVTITPPPHSHHFPSLRQLCLRPALSAPSPTPSTPWSQQQQKTLASSAVLYRAKGKLFISTP